MTLKKDLNNCPGDGIVIGADNITLDLNGHKIDGTGNGTGVSMDGPDGVTVRNGTIKEFGAGMFIQSSDGDLIKRLRVSENQGTGIILDGADDNRLKRNTVTGNGVDGIVVGAANNTRVSKNTATENGAVGINVISSDDNRLARNTASNNDEEGIFVTSNSTATILSENQADKNGSGVNGIDVQATDAATTITENSANRNDNLGIFAAAGVTDGGGNTAHKNGNPAQCQGVNCN